MRSFCHVALFTVVACGYLASPAAHAVKPAAAAPASSSCDCGAGPWRTYPAVPTPVVQQLFRAATEGDEATFMRLLEIVPNLADYAVDDKPLLAALLEPPRHLRSRRVTPDIPEDEANRIRAAHRALMPAKTRMLKAALEKGASTKDVTYGSRIMPLHLATVYGTPEMVRALLAHGADPNLPELDSNRTPLEFILSDNDSVRLNYLPVLVTKAERTEMVLALLQAGAGRPFMSLDGNEELKLKRPAADLLAWGPLIDVTEGAEVLQAMLATGTKPAYDGVGMTPLAHAAWTGNLGAVTALKSIGPRTFITEDESGPDSKRLDAWLDAAMFAMHGKNDAIIDALVEPDMPWEQTGPVEDTFTRDRRYPRFEHSNSETLMRHAVDSGRVAWVQRLAKMGSAIDIRALHIATERGDHAMAVALVELGADPWGEYFDNQPLRLALQKNDLELVAKMLTRLTPQQKAVLAHTGDWLFDFDPKFEGAEEAALAQLKLLVRNGISPKSFGPVILTRAIRQSRYDLARHLIEQGAPVDAPAEQPTERDDMPLLAAVDEQQTELIDLLLQRGARVTANPEQLDAIDLAVVRGDLAILDRLLAAGGMLADTGSDEMRKPRVIELALVSGNPAMVRRVLSSTQQSIEHACLDLPEGRSLAPLLNLDGYFAELRKIGLSASQHCEGQGPLRIRIATYLSRRDELPLMGLRAARASEIFGAAAGDTLNETDPETGLSPLHYAVRNGRIDTVELLLRAGANPNHADASGQTPGWLAFKTGQAHLFSLLMKHGIDLNTPTPSGHPLGLAIRCSGISQFTVQLQGTPQTAGPACPIPRRMSASEARLAKSVVGHYYLENLMEVGSEILLRKDGTFAYMLSYGATDEVAAGTWQVSGNQVRFTTPPPALAEPFKWTKAEPAADGKVTVAVYHNGRTVPGVDIAVATDQDTKYGRTKREPAALDITGVVRAMALRHPSLNDGRWSFITAPHGELTLEGSRNFTFEVEPAATDGTPFNVAMRINGRQLIATRSGRTLYYVRHPKKAKSK